MAIKANKQDQIIISICLIFHAAKIITNCPVKFDVHALKFQLQEKQYILIKSNI